MGRAIVPIGRVYEKNDYKYRELKEHEIEAIFINFEKHNGNVEAMKRDNTCQFSGREQLDTYVKRYGFKIRLGKYRQEIIDNWKKTNKKMLNAARVTLLNRAFELLNDREYDIATKSGEVITVQKPPTSVDIKIAWEIIKSELGEPTKITEKKKDDLDKKIKRISVEFKDYSNVNKPKQIIQAPIRKE